MVVETFDDSLVHTLFRVRRILGKFKSQRRYVQVLRLYYFIASMIRLNKNINRVSKIWLWKL